MSKAFKTCVAAVETYLDDLRRIRATGSATEERSMYGPLANLINAIGGALKPKVFCIGELADQGAGHPDFGLYAASQGQRGKREAGQVPERGVVEVKGVGDDVWATAKGDQVRRYCDHYGLVLVCNTREFVLVGPDADGRMAALESFCLADTEEAFVHRLENPRAFARDIGAGLREYLSRALSHRTALTDPKDLAWLLASYAREGLARVERAEAAGDVLSPLRSALEDALGVRFEGERGVRFFHSTLVQTLFYGVFSAWVLWSRTSPAGALNWRETVWHLRVPVLQALFQQLSDPNRLRPLGLVEVLDYTGAALNRVDRAAFFARFDEGDAVPYFYEPFLEAFDPELRKQLGVWYTPAEVVRYMVARVDRALKDDLDIADGLAAENVYVLDPCCGTGAYLSEVLRRIAANLKGRGLGALTGARIKRAATERVFGFEIMPAPFVVSHLQVGLTMQALDAPLDNGTERPGVFLTNALTGWEPTNQKPLPFPELEEERDRAGQVKRDTPILVILGNPPYNGFAGIAVDEERELSQAYRTTRRVRHPEGQGLNDLYIRFFRMAERRIAEKTGQGVICFISNYSWLDGLSFTGMRERYLEAFDAIRIDCLNGDVRKGGRTPDGKPDLSVFTTERTVGIQVGTAIATLVRKVDHTPVEKIGFRHLWGSDKREKLIETEDAEPDTLYETVEPILPLGLPFAQMAVSEHWFDWLALPDLFPIQFPGVKTSRDAFLLDIDLHQLKARITDYFDANLSHEEIAQKHPAAMKDTASFNARSKRDTLLKRGSPDKNGFVRFTYRPFDNRWLYWEADSGLIDRPRAEYKPHVFKGNMWIEAREREAMENFTRGTLVRHLADNLGNGLSSFFPAYLRDDGLVIGGIQRRPNLSGAAQRYLDHLGLGVEDLFHHVLAVLHDPAYRKANADALRMEWPRIPLPGYPDGNATGAADALAQSAARGRELACLLDPETPVPGVTEGALRAEIAAIAIPATTDGRNMAGDDFALTAGWGHFGRGSAVMPGRGRAVERDYTRAERAACNSALPALGETTFDIYLNDRAYWRNIPTEIYHYKLGGYQVLKKWLSYREHAILNRALTLEEIQHFTDTARRIGAILLATT